MPSILISTEKWPIVVHTTLGSPSDQDVDEYIRAANAILGREMVHVAVMDSTRAGAISPYLRKRSREWLTENHDRLRKHCLGTAFVFSSPALRFILTTMLVFQPHPTPYIVCKTVDEAFAWAKGLLQKASAESPSP